MNQTIDVVEWLQERAFRMYGPTMEAAHTKTKEWLWADEITRLRADLAAVTAERDAAKRSAYEDAARFIEENVFNYSSGDQNYWSHRKGDNAHGLEYAREFRKKAAAIRSGK